MSDALKPLIGAAADRPLTREEAQAAFTILFEGEATPSQIGGLLMALRTRGETVQEYAAAASVMREKCNRVTAPEGAIDIVGTGGTPEENGRALAAVLSGQKGAYRDAVLLNAAAALLIAGRAANLAEGIEIAAESSDAGRGAQKLEGLARITSSA